MLARYIIVIVFELFEVRIVVTDELINMKILPFLNLVYLNFEFELEFLFKF